MLDILLVDDDGPLRLAIAKILDAQGHRVSIAGDGAEAVAQLNETVFDLVVSDVRLPKVDGFTILRKVKRVAPTTDVILITAYGSVGDAVVAMRESARDYIMKPFPMDTILRQVQQIEECRQLANTGDEAREELAARRSSDTLVGRAPCIERLRDDIATIAESDAAVLVSGESGTGKELVARMIHDRSPRRGRPFVTVNCGALPASLIETELFGHERGAFTGAVRKRVGRLEAAHGGTLFLDEIAEAPPEAQVKLLRVLQERSFERVGSDQTLKIDVRLVSATNQDLRSLINRGGFREDLYYRIKVFELVLPPLRARRGDLNLLTKHFLREFTPDGHALPAVTPAAAVALEEYDFPGNVRELRHAIQHATILAGGRDIDVQHLPIEMRRESTRSVPTAVRPLLLAVEEHERQLIQHTLKLAGDRKGRAAALLGISRKALWQKLKKYGVS